MCFGFDDWIYCTLYIKTRDYRQYSSVAILHTFHFTVTHALGFSVFTSHVLATDLSQSRRNFKLCMKSSFHVLIFSCHYSVTATSKDSTQFNSSAPKFISWQTGILKFDSSLPTAILYSTWSCLLCPFITPRHGPRGKHSLYC
jgi:hypothetical protein